MQERPTSTVPGPGGIEAEPPAGWIVALATALGYAVIGWMALSLAEAPGYASPLYPSAGLALAATLVYGRSALPGVALGAFSVNLLLATLRSPGQPPDVMLPAIIALGAMLQAALGTLLVRRFCSQPLTLNHPRDVLAAGVLGAGVACLVSPSIATSALLGLGALDQNLAGSTWFTWWLGDTLGVLIGAPLVLSLIGRPRDDWAPRRLTLGVPMLLAGVLLGAAMAVLEQRDTERLRATFERDADRLSSEAEARLRAPLGALQAVHSAALAVGELDAVSLRVAARWWLQQPMALQSLGYSVAVPRSQIAALEATARAEGFAGYRVFEREGISLAAGDDIVLAMRQIEPRAGNQAALGVNALSVPAARPAVLAARRSGEPAATAGFRLTQSATDETGMVLFQAIYDEGPQRGGPPTDAAAREAAFRGVVFVAVRTEALLARLRKPDQSYLQWCLFDRAADATRPLLGGSPGCVVDAAARSGGRDAASAAAPAAASAAASAATAAVTERAAGARKADTFTTRRALSFGGRPLELHLSAPLRGVPGQQREAAWLLWLVGLTASALLGAMLLIVTGHTRRTQRAVTLGTAELRREMQERTRAQDALAESESRLRSILDHVPIGVMFMDPRGNLLDINPRLAEMLGRSGESVRGLLLTDITHPDDWESNLRLRRELIGGRITLAQRQMRMVGADGRWLWVRAGVTVLRDADGRVQRMVGVVEDITEHLRLEASERALQQAEASSRAKSEFVSRMSHELRTPLNAMIGFSQLLGMDREPALAPHQQEWTKHVQRAGWHLLELINETLDLARIEAGAVQFSLQPLSLAPLLAQCRAMVAAAAAQRSIRFDEQVEAAETLAVTADPTRLKQVLTNLLSNAVKYNRSGGTVTVQARATAVDTVEILVSDTGLGMTPEQLADLFQPYNRLGREHSTVEGTGIGLVISRRLAELMGGSLDAHSQAGAGSTFMLRLPRAETLPPTVAEPASAAVPPYQQRRVHYVEDNQTNIEVMRGILLQRPQIVMDVTTMGLDCVPAVRRQRPDLILLDMQLPDISGLELLRHLKNDDSVADIPVIVVSADATPGRMQEALTLGAMHYVTKPVDVARFLRLIDEVLEGLETRWGM